MKQKNFDYYIDPRASRMVCRIADFNIELIVGYNHIKRICEDYVIDDTSETDFYVVTTKEDIDTEIALATEQGEYHGESRSYLESLAVYRKIAAKVLSYDAFLMHGALIEYEGKGYLFTAKSGTGKTTHINLWRQTFGEDKVTIVNGDKPIIRFIDGKVYAYGTPWCGKEGYNVNKRVELCGVAFIERDEENSIVKISDLEALPRILSQVMVADSANLEKQLDLLDRLLNSVPTYLLKCNMNADAAIIAHDGMKPNLEV